jgi:hypothetical protein
VLKLTLDLVNHAGAGDHKGEQGLTKATKLEPDKTSERNRQRGSLFRR